LLSEAQRTDIRRHLRVPVAGLANTNYYMGVEAYDPDVPYYAQPAAIDERMSSLRPTEESAVTGFPIAGVIMTGMPDTTSSISLTATSQSTGAIYTLCTYNVSASDVASTEPLYSIACNLIIAINIANNPYISVVGNHTPGGIYSAAQAEITIQAITSDAFTIGITATNFAAYVSDQGTFPNIAANFKSTAGGAALTAYGLLPILDYLESAIASSANYAAFSAVKVVTFDPNELVKRMEQYRFYQIRLAELFFGSHGAEYLNGGRGGRNGGGAGAIV
jgi:hypothetical protein